jgi:tRNA A-37 threonylcarbamoyl transferase component Bud32/tetratricopeptide (TPR) repeat protein
MPPADERSHPTPPEPVNEAATVGFTPSAGGPYAGLTPHGRGGLGEVFRATDPELNRAVAVKRLHDRHADHPEARRRFLVEAEVTARLEHPGVVPVYRLYHDEQGQPAYAMRFVEGQTLAQAVATYHAGPADPVVFRRLLQAFLQVCQTVAYAHSRGVIHRDLKPANVMLGRFGEALVVDWGLAKVVGRPEAARAAGAEETLQPASSDPDNGPGATALGSAVGTPSYMSPEQAAGRWDVVDHRSDVYGLGAVLYTVLTGRPPLEKGNWPEIQQQIQRGAFPRPRQVKSEVPRPLEAVCLKAMALEPQDRFPSAQALAADVEHWLADEPVAAYPEPLGARARRWGRRHRTIVSAAAVLLVAGLVATVAGLVLLGRKNDEIAAKNAEVTAERNTAQEAAAEAQAINAFLTGDLLGQADPDVNDRSKKLTVEELLHRAAQKIDGNAKFADKPEVEATLRMTIGKTYYTLDNGAEAVRQLRRAVDLRRACLPPDDPRTLAAQDALAEALLRGLENPAEAAPLARQTWEARKRVLGPAHRDTLYSLDIYASALDGLGHKDEALALMQECLAGRRSTLGPEDRHTLESMNNVAVILLHQGDWKQASELLREAVTIQEPKGMGLDHFPMAANLGHCLYFLGDLDTAEDILTRYADRAARQFGPDHAVSRHIRSYQARVWVENGKADRAVGSLEELIAARSKQAPEGDWRTASYLVDLGRARLAWGGPPDRAVVALEKACQMYRASPPPPNAYYPPWADACHGMALLALGKYDKAEPLLLDAEQRLRGMAVCPRRHYRQTVESLVTLYERWDRPAEAAKWRRELDVPGKGT